jgi:hypothetical protein
LAEEERARRAYLETFDEPDESFVIGCDLNRDGRADLPQTERYLRCRQAYLERVAITNRIIAELAALAEENKKEAI